MPSERFEMRIPTSLLESLDRARGHESRASFIKRALERELGGRGPGTPAAVTSPCGSGSVKEVRATESPAPSRASKRDGDAVYHSPMPGDPPASGEAVLDAEARRQPDPPRWGRVGPKRSVKPIPKGK